ncbi:potassium channel AKT1-like protein [Tanacetum coccineum]|uniref:Potassium channel AKT1-like protein n=1 Tax=Tanacetum coccineum TaxID=301880 RepID=A0ABQ5IEF3_9ASTR
MTLGQGWKKEGESVVIQLREFLEHSGSFTGKNIHQGGMVLPFQPLSMAFSNINYYVDVPLVTLFAIHSAGCFYYYLAAHYPNPGRTWIGYGNEDFEQESLWIRYVTSMYSLITTLTTVGYGDLHAQKNQFLARLQDQMLAHLCLRFRTDSEQLQQKESLDSLPIAIRSSISQFSFFSLLDKAYLFHGVPDDLLFQLEDVILQNEAPTDFYVLVTGTVELVVTRNGVEHTIFQLSPILSSAYHTYANVDSNDKTICEGGAKGSELSDGDVLLVTNVKLVIYLQKNRRVNDAPLDKRRKLKSGRIMASTTSSRGRQASCPRKRIQDVWSIWKRHESLYKMEKEFSIDHAMEKDNLRNISWER